MCRECIIHTSFTSVWCFWCRCGCLAVIQWGQGQKRAKDSKTTGEVQISSDAWNNVQGVQEMHNTLTFCICMVLLMLLWLSSCCPAGTSMKKGKTIRKQLENSTCQLGQVGMLYDDMSFTGFFHGFMFLDNISGVYKVFSKFTIGLLQHFTTLISRRRQPL